MPNKTNFRIVSNNQTFKYYLTVLSFYLLEIFAVWFFIKYFTDLFVINFFARSINTILASIIMKKWVFNSTNTFYFKYILVFVFNIMLSSVLIDLFSSIASPTLLFSKLIIDIFVSLLSYYLLSFLSSE